MYDHNGDEVAPEDVLDAEELDGLSPERKRRRRLPLPGTFVTAWAESALCIGCGVREPFEHRCVSSLCSCGECREADRLFGPA